MDCQGGQKESQEDHGEVKQKLRGISLAILPLRGSRGVPDNPSHVCI